MVVIFKDTIYASDLPYRIHIFPTEGALQSYLTPYPSICSHSAVVWFLHIFPLLRVTPLLPT